MKKLLCMILAGMMALSLIACSNEKTEETKVEEAVEAKVEETEKESKVEETEEAKVEETEEAKVEETEKESKVEETEEEAKVEETEEEAKVEETEEVEEDSTVAEYIAENGDVLIGSLTKSAKGMVDAEIKAEGNTIVIDMAYKTISSSQIAGQEDKMVELFDSMYGNLNLVEMLQKDVAEVDGLKIIVSTNDGKEIYNRTFK